VLGSDASIIWLQGESTFITRNTELAGYILMIMMTTGIERLRIKL
jgi:hypothetical protein